MLDAARSKARRGELRLSVPFGYIWHREAGLGLDPDLRLQDVIRSIFARFHELGSARQVLLSMTKDQIHFPRPSDEGRMRPSADKLGETGVGTGDSGTTSADTKPSKSLPASRPSRYARRHVFNSERESPYLRAVADPSRGAE